MSLNINLENITGPGRPAKPLTAEFSRELTEADIAHLAVAPRGVQAPNLQKLTDRHHALARQLAAGVSPGDAALTLGYDPSRVSIIQQSPAFQDLLSVYRAEVNREFASYNEHRAGLARDALLELRERFENDPTSMTNRELLSITDQMTEAADAVEHTDLPVMIELVGRVDDPS